jgi:tRNA(Ile)-lysidine synthase
MPRARDLAQGVHLLRPLLLLRRREIVAYARAAQLPWLEDLSNSDERYTRNRQRHSVLPTLKHYSPGITEA